MSANNVHGAAETSGETKAERSGVRFSEFVSKNAREFSGLGALLCFYFGGKYMMQTVRSPTTHTSMEFDSAGSHRGGADNDYDDDLEMILMTEFSAEPHASVIITRLRDYRSLSIYDYRQTLAYVSDLFRLVNVLSRPDGHKFVRRDDGTRAAEYRMMAIKHLTQLSRCASSMPDVQAVIEHITDSMREILDHHYHQIQRRCDDLPIADYFLLPTTTTTTAPETF